MQIASPFATKSGTKKLIILRLVASPRKAGSEWWVGNLFPGLAVWMVLHYSFSCLPSCCAYRGLRLLCRLSATWGVAKHWPLQGIFLDLGITPGQALKKCGNGAGGASRER